MSATESNPPIKRIAVVWDFDGTLSPEDSTTKTIKYLEEEGVEPGLFWKRIKAIRGDQDLKEWEHILASDAPIWMYALSRLAFRRGVPLNTEFFREFILPDIQLFPSALEMLKAIKDLTHEPEFRALNLQVHHFIVSAGLKDLIQLVFPDGLVTWTFGCRYEVMTRGGPDPSPPESIPVFCMDETVKTRSIFEISKGSFSDESKPVNDRVPQAALWAPFENIIYVGDGPTDIPALSLVRDKGGMGVAVFDESKDLKDRNKSLKPLRDGRRADLIAPAKFGLDAPLHKFLKARCIQIRQRYEAEVGV